MFPDSNHAIVTSFPPTMKFVKQEGFRLPVPRFRGRAFDVKNHVVAGIGEFVGTFLFLFFGYATQSMALQQAGYTGPDSTPSSLTVVIIAMGYGFSLLATAWVLYRVSGGLFNPAITLCLVISGVLSWRRGLVLFPCQILGGIVAAALVDCMLPSSIDITKTALAPGVSPAQGVFLEMFFTCELAVTVLFLAAEKSKVTFLAPLGIGLSLFVAEIGGLCCLCVSLTVLEMLTLQASTGQAHRSTRRGVSDRVLRLGVSKAIIGSTGSGLVWALS